jgi:hypothetical protein
MDAGKPHSLAIPSYVSVLHPRHGDRFRKRQLGRFPQEAKGHEGQASNYAGGTVGIAVDCRRCELSSIPLLIDLLDQ